MEPQFKGKTGQVLKTKKDALEFGVPPEIFDEKIHLTKNTTTTGAPSRAGDATPKKEK